LSISSKNKKAISIKCYFILCKDPSLICAVVQQLAQTNLEKKKTTKTRGCNQGWEAEARQFCPEPLTVFVLEPELEPQKIYKLWLRLCGNEKLLKPKKGAHI